MENGFHLAQVNIARAKAPLDHPLMKGFVDQLERINTLAERSPGFIWRLENEEGDATTIRLFEDERIIVNLSLWASLGALKAYVYSGEHLAVLKNKKNWFEKLDRPSLALWWLPVGQIPDLGSAKAALAKLQEKGATPEAFTFARPYPVPLEPVYSVS